MNKSQYFKEWSNGTIQDIKSRLVKNDDDCVDVTVPSTDEEIDLRSLCNEYTNLKAALTCIEISVDVIKDDIRETRVLLETQNMEFEHKIKNLETKYENKLTVFMSAISIDCEDKIIRKATNINDELLAQKTSISNMESRLEKSISRKTSEVNFVKNCNCVENLPKWIDIENMKNMFNTTQQTTSDNLDTLRLKTETIDRKIESLNNQHLDPS